MESDSAFGSKEEVRSRPFLAQYPARLGGGAMNDSTSSSDKADVASILTLLVSAVVILPIVSVFWLRNDVATQAQTIANQEQQIQELKASLTKCESAFQGYRDGRR
ncbi:MAG TPA: hypothetical protein V6D12_00325 [Candidatus Obscuribacterales bacterium]